MLTIIIHIYANSPLHTLIFNSHQFPPFLNHLGISHFFFLFSTPINIPFPLASYFLRLYLSPVFSFLFSCHLFGLLARVSHLLFISHLTPISCLSAPCTLLLPLHLATLRPLTFTSSFLTSTCLTSHYLPPTLL